MGGDDVTSGRSFDPLIFSPAERTGQFWLQFWLQKLAPANPKLVLDPRNDLGPSKLFFGGAQVL